MSRGKRDIIQEMIDKISEQVDKLNRLINNIYLGEMEKNIHRKKRDKLADILNGLLEDHHPKP